MTQQLVIDHVSKVFGGLKAVADVTMTIEQGTLIALIGPNGAGKTTLFNMLTGESGPSSGTITLYTADGPVDITKKKAYQVAKLGVARTFQNIRLFGAMIASGTPNEIQTNAQVISAYLGGENHA